MADHTLHQISSHVFWLSPDSTTDRPVLGAIAGTRGTLIVDSGNSPAHAHVLLRELERRGLPSPAYVALTHWHWDHVFGTSAFNLPTIASTETKRIVDEMAQLDWSDAALDQRVELGVEIAFCRDMMKRELPDRSDLVIRPPDIAFVNQVDIDLGGVTCQLLHVGGDHAIDSTVVYVPEDKIVFLSDCVYPDIYHTARRYTTAKLFPLLDRLLSLDGEYYLAGHNDEPWSRSFLVEEAALLHTIGEIVEAHSPDRAAILAAVEARLGAPPNEDHKEIVDEFFAGLSC